MTGPSPKRSPILNSEAFNIASREMMHNETAFQITHDYRSVDALSDALHEMGQHKLISMNSGFRQAMVSMIFYAGDGNVIKVMPNSSTGGNYVLQIPPISEKRVETDMRSYVIQTYPLLQGRPATDTDVFKMKQVIEALGMKFGDGDDTPRNLTVLPDGEGTLACLDADGFKTGRNGLNYGPELYEQWTAYIKELFPVYQAGEIPRQTSETCFEFRMNHNRESGLARFDPLSRNPIGYIHQDEAPAAPKHHWWNIFTTPGHG